MKSVEVVLDQPGKSVLKCTVDVCFILPCLTYIVESTYSPLERIDYKRVGGAIKDFRGEWRITPACQGRKSEVSYSMYIEPGFPVPQWIVRQGVKVELPRTLRALRKRVHAVYRLSQLPERRTILASGSHLNAG